MTDPDEPDLVTAAAERVCDAAHASPNAQRVGHRDTGFCLACAEIYVAVSMTLDAQETP